MSRNGWLHCLCYMYSYYCLNLLVCGEKISRYCSIWMMQPRYGDKFGFSTHISLRVSKLYGADDLSMGLDFGLWSSSSTADFVILQSNCSGNTWIRCLILGERNELSWIRLKRYKNLKKKFGEFSVGTHISVQLCQQSPKSHWVQSSNNISCQTIIWPCFPGFLCSTGWMW